MVENMVCAENGQFLIAVLIIVEISIQSDLSGPLMRQGFDIYMDFV